jgi:hypothetical protein
VEPAPLPKSLWTMPPDTSVVWDAYHPCKNYSCLASHGFGFGFDLRGRREKAFWMRDDGAIAYSVKAVITAKPKGTVRVGIDIGNCTDELARVNHGDRDHPCRRAVRQLRRASRARTN